MQVWDLIQRLIGADLRGYDIGDDFKDELSKDVAVETLDDTPDIKDVRFVSETNCMLIELDV